MKLKEAQKQIWEKASLKEKLLLFYWGIFFDIEHRFRMITKICPHDSTTGEVGAKKHICLDCQKIVHNDEWKEERKALTSPD